MTRIHADIRRPALVQAGALPWEPSPAAGVERRRIERIGDELARVTSVVRYAAGSSFPEHVHGGGEEFIVLDGIFCDEHGAYPAGSYVRNPVGSRHSPFTEVGCTLLVKLWWMHADQQRRVVLDLNGDDDWHAVAFGQRRTLYADDHERVYVLRLDAGAVATLEPAGGGRELFCLRGGCRVDGADVPAHSWIRQPDAGASRIEAQDETWLWLKEGQLRAPPPLPS